MVSGKHLAIRSAATKAFFIEPMLCLAVGKLPEGPARHYEVKLVRELALSRTQSVGPEAEQMERTLCIWTIG